MNEELTTFQRKQLQHMKIQTALLACLLILVLTTSAFMVIQLSGVSTDMQAMDLELIRDTVGSLKTVTAKLDEVNMDSINAAVVSLQKAADTLSQADIAAINDGIKALSDAAGNLNEIDMEQLNALIATMQTVATQLETTTSAFSKLFGR